MLIQAKNVFDTAAADAGIRLAPPEFATGRRDIKTVQLLYRCMASAVRIIL